MAATPWALSLNVIFEWKLCRPFWKKNCTPQFYTRVYACDHLLSSGHSPRCFHTPRISSNGVYITLLPPKPQTWVTYSSASQHSSCVFFTWFDMEHQLFGGPCPPISRGNSWVKARTGYEPPWVTAAISQGFTPHWVLGNVRDQESSCWNLWRRLWTLRNLSLVYMFVFMRSTWFWFKLVQVGEILGWFHLQVISYSQSYRDCGTRYGGKLY